MTTLNLNISLFNYNLVPNSSALYANSPLLILVTSKFNHFKNFNYPTSGHIVQIYDFRIHYYQRIRQNWLPIVKETSFTHLLKPQMVKTLNHDYNFNRVHIWTKFVWNRTPCETFSASAKLGSQSGSSQFKKYRCAPDAELIHLLKEHYNFTAKFTTKIPDWIWRKRRIAVEARVSNLFDSSGSNLVVTPTLLGFGGSRYNFIAYCRFRQRFPVTIFAWLVPFRSFVWYSFLAMLIFFPITTSKTIQTYFVNIFTEISNLFGQSDKVDTIPELLFVFSCIILCSVYSTFIEGSIIAPYDARPFVSLQAFINSSYQIIHSFGRKSFLLLYAEGRTDFTRLGINMTSKVFLDLLQPQYQNTTREQFISEGNKAGHYSYYTDLSLRGVVVQKLENSVTNFRRDVRMRCFGLEFGGTVPTYFEFPPEFMSHMLQTYQQIIESGLMFGHWVKSHSHWTIRKHIVSQEKIWKMRLIADATDNIGLKNLLNFLAFLGSIFLIACISFVFEMKIHLWAARTTTF
ncbi:hypothetical protein Fcan01_01596 [Folsomia candida]|uniref:Uncharacterized protein n=1 Tax=Folsomia candida TaxID=158441 RepID=A0A226F145_FOLCA|nr:hypothetical protein Fcan01_01596 [Folsomia candida]